MKVNLDTRGVADEDVVDLDKGNRRRVRRRSLRLLWQVTRRLRGQCLLVLLLVGAAQATKAAGPVIIAAAVNVALPSMQHGNSTPLVLYVIALAVVAAAAGLLGWGAIRRTAAVSQSALLSLRRRVFGHVQRLSLGFHERYTSGRAIARQTSDLDAIRELLDSGINQLLASVVFMGFVATMLFSLDPISGCLLLVAAIPAYVLTRWFQHRSQLYYRATRVASANLIVQFVESMTGIRAVQAFRQERATSAEHGRLAHEYYKADTQAQGLTGVYNPTLLLIGNLTVAAMLALDGYRVLRGDLPVGDLIAAVLYAQRFFSPLDQMALFYNSLQSAVASLEKISRLLEEEPDLDEPAHPTPLRRPAGDIVFDDVTFGYRPSVPIVEHMNLHVPAGQTLALVGATGAGKSTVAKLIARFYDVNAGAVRIDGVDVRDLSFADLRRHVVVVTQENFLFSGTVADNIALGKPDASAAEIEAAARKVGAHEFIAALPDGYDTDVNTRGTRLSAGQRQLVAFARAFIADPTVLILDEATSSLDLAGEAQVQRALTTLLRGRTAVIIAHRLSTVDVADRLLVFSHGEIVEDGSPDELARSGGQYAELRSTWDTAMAPEDPGIRGAGRGAGLRARPGNARGRRACATRCAGTP